MESEWLSGAPGTMTEARLSKTPAHGIVDTRSPYREKALWISQSLFPMIWPTIYSVLRPPRGISAVEAQTKDFENALLAFTIGQVVESPTQAEFYGLAGCRWCDATLEVPVDVHAGRFVGFGEVTLRAPQRIPLPPPPLKNPLRAGQIAGVVRAKGQKRHLALLVVGHQLHAQRRRIKRQRGLEIADVQDDVSNFVDPRLLSLLGDCGPGTPLTMWAAAKILPALGQCKRGGFPTTPDRCGGDGKRGQEVGKVVRIGSCPSQ